jgi:hypothetical protein
MNKLSATVACLVLVNVCYSQKATVKGNILDSFNQKHLANAVIALLQAKDSTLSAFARSDVNGSFELSRLKAGHYLMLITAPAYADYVDTLTLTDTSHLNYGNLFLLLKARLLEDVVVRQTVAAIKIKGDTTEYKADSFRVKPNASVEELLKRLPGIQVDKNGKIKAYGETVNRVLVDGEEFFGDDPTLVTQNLRADMIDKVQVYDKKSDQAVFTGVDDGQKSKTINLKLKEDKKKGYFGKLSAGTGTEGFHDIQGMFNFFKKKQKLAGFGIKSTTGTTGLDWRDSETFGAGSSLSYSEGGMSYVSNSGDDDSWNGSYNGQGLPQVKTGGLHYSNKWNEDKVAVNGNYKVQDLEVKEAGEGTTQFLLPDSSYYSIYSKSSFNNALRHKLDGSYEITLDSTSSLKISASGTQEHKESTETNYTASLASDSALVNESMRRTSSAGDNRSLSSSLLWRKKLPKKGRTLSVAFNGKYKSRETSGYLDANTSFYSKGLLDSIQHIDQLKLNNSSNLSIDANLTYSEPLSSFSSLVFNYGVVLNNNTAERSSYNKDGDKYGLFDSTYSSNYAFNVFTHKGGVSYNFAKKKFRINAGGNIGVTSFSQDDLLRNNNRSRNFINWFPSASFNYALAGNRNISVQYSGNTRQPDINSIQPLRTNDNPLFVTIGNPDLKPSFANSIRFSYQSYKMLTGRNLHVDASISTTQNAISNRSEIDKTGKTTTQAVNLNGNRSGSLSIEYGFKWKKTDLYIIPGVRTDISRNMNYVNGLLNETNNGNYGISLMLFKYKEAKYDIGLQSTATYTNSKSSVQQSLKTNYWTYYIRPEIGVFFPLGMELHNTLDVNLRQKLSPADQNNNVVLWNAWIGKKFLKNESLLLKLSANDLLNQNTGFNRSVGGSSIAESTYLTIRRYGLISLVWNFNKMGTISK